MKSLWADALLACSLVVSGNACAKEPIDGLRLEVRAEEGTVPVRGAFQLCAEIHNDNALEPMTLYGDLGWGYGGGFVVEIRDAAKNKVEPRFLDDSHLIPTTLDDKAYFVAVQPRHFLGTCRSDKVKDLFGHPGKYEVIVRYRSPVPNEFAQGENFIGLEKGWVESNVVSVEVTP